MRRTLERTAAWAALGVLAVLVAGCGGSSSPREASNRTDRGFVDDMTQHHRGAVAMARLGVARAQHPQLRALARAIVASQRRELSRLRGLRATFAAQGADGLETLPLDKDSVGMTMDDRGLKAAKPFDRAFIDMMVPHHAGALAMANLELKNGQNPRAKGLARAIVAAQTREIEQMKRWRERWYGKPGAMSGGGSMPGMQMGG